MDKLIKPVEYAQQLGISRQAVYAKIKRGILQSKSVDGKLYIVVKDENRQANVKETADGNGAATAGNSAAGRPAAVNADRPVKDYESLLRAKDETISVLKGTVKDLKKSNKQMSTTLRGEIELLKEAFHEMRTMYVTQIEHIRQEAMQLSETPIDVSEFEEARWVGLKKLFKKYNVDKKKKQELLSKKIMKAYKKGDSRIRMEGKKIQVNINEKMKDLFG